MKILITGAKGYIGKALVDSLQHKYNITSITRDDFDLTNYKATCEFFQDKYFDIVIHTATVGGNRLKDEDNSILRQNLDMYYNLITNNQYFGKFISFGSGAEIGWPTTPYGYSKRIIAESMLNKDYCLNLRVFAVFDKNELDRRFIKSNLIRYINQEDLIVHKNKRMDFFYMIDLIALVDYHIQRSEWLYNTLDCRYTNSYSLLEIAQMINKLSNYRMDILVGNDTDRDYVGNYIGLPIRLVGLEAGIVETYNKLKHESDN